MIAFTRHSGIAVGLDLANVDTDQIIPVRFLTRSREEGFADALFHNLRRDGKVTGPRVIEWPLYQGATILVTGRNFGCGSSREQAVWALLDFGFRCVIAPSFGDLFYNNACTNGLLPVRLDEPLVAEILRDFHDRPRGEISVDLAGETVLDTSGRGLRFDIDPFWKNALLQGMTDLQITQRHSDEIARFERMHKERMCWMFGEECR